MEQTTFPITWCVEALTARSLTRCVSGFMLNPAPTSCKRRTNQSAAPGHAGSCDCAFDNNLLWGQRLIHLAFLRSVESTVITATPSTASTSGFYRDSEMSPWLVYWFLPSKDTPPPPPPPTHNELTVQVQQLRSISLTQWPFPVCSMCCGLRPMLYLRRSFIITLPLSVWTRWAGLRAGFGHSEKHRGQFFPAPSVGDGEMEEMT